MPFGNEHNFRLIRNCMIEPMYFGVKIMENIKTQKKQFRPWQETGESEHVRLIAAQ